VWRSGGVGWGRNTAASGPEMDACDIPSIKSLLVLDADGKRIVCRYYKNDFANFAEETAFEKKLFDKTSRTNAKNEAEIIMFDNLVSVYRNSGDVWFYVVGNQAENELVLVNALVALYDALSAALRATPDKRALVDNFDVLSLTIDELIDGGMILETDPTAIVNRVGMKGSDAAAAAGAETTFSEQSFNTMFASAREQIARSLLK